MTVRPDGVDGSVLVDTARLKTPVSNVAKPLDCEVTIVENPLARRKLRQNFAVACGKVDEKGG